MSGADLTPVVILTFANDPANPLANLVSERKNIEAALKPHEDRRYIKRESEPNAVLEDVFRLVRDYGDRVAILHYAGHADGGALLLETAVGTAEAAHANALAQRIGQCRSLQLVCLNGCATQGQVAALLEAGVPLVIATSAPINDAMATEFATQFYRDLGARKSIGNAFATARDYVEAKDGGKRGIIDESQAANRGAFMAAVTRTPPAATWGIFTGPDRDKAQAALDWTIPDRAASQINITQVTSLANGEARDNSELIVALAEAVSPHSKQVRRAIEDLDPRRPDLRTICQPLIAAFPTPVGEQLRKLFHEENATIGEERLQQTLRVYEAITQLFAFAGLSQLWIEMALRPALVISDAQRSSLAAFANLSAESAPAFDHFSLVQLVADVFVANDIVPFLAESQQFGETLRDEASIAARAFLEAMRAALRGRIAADDIAPFCVQAEVHLVEIVKDFAFIVGYMMASIKDITLFKTRNRSPEYSHKIVQLDQAGQGSRVLDEKQAAFSDSRSVILLKSLDDIADNLNLTPFIIDDNALQGIGLSRVYFFAHRVPTAAACQYYAIDDFDMKLVVSNAKHPEIRDLFDAFRQAVATVPA